MKKLILFLFVTLIGFNYACSEEEECRSLIIGTYKGTEICPGVSDNQTLILSTALKQGDVKFTIGGTSIHFDGSVSSHCSAISVAKQTLLVNNNELIIEGNFTVIDNVMNGMLIFADGNICDYSLHKQ